MQSPRLYDLGSVYNFRDFGGYATVDGGRVAEGKLFRAAHLSAVNDNDLATIAGLGIDLVVDLRYKPERERQPNRFWSGGPSRHLEFAPVEASITHKVAPHEAFIEQELHGPDDARRYMTQSYGARPHDPGFKRIFANTLSHMSEAGDPILIHCAAGKDRTGTLAAVILSALGVDRDTIMDDFMLTMQAVDVDAILEPASAMIAKRIGRDITPEDLRPMFAVEPGYLEASFDAMGDVEGYLEGSLGLTPDRREALREHYLA